MTAFDRVWNILKGENIYHSVHIKPRTSEEAQRISDLQTEMLDRGISFDTGGGLDGGRDWELDFSLKGATADEVMAELRATGIPFQTEMWADTAESAAERGPSRNIADYEDGGVVIGHTNCPECKGQNGMLIQEGESLGGGITLGCNDCGYTETDFGGSDDDGDGMIV